MPTYTLPWPPSANTHWVRRKNGGIRISDKARAFRENVYAVVLEAGRKRIDGRVAVSMVAHPPPNVECDIDNFQKETLDALTACQCWIDDSQIDDLRIVRGEVVKGGKMVVEIKEIGT
jgi:crossover junction endodeoxyribonuclease RusA